jgi:hypothetical protein
MAGGPVRPDPDPPPPELRIDFQDHEALSLAGLSSLHDHGKLRAGGHCGVAGGVAGAEEEREAGPRTAAGNRSRRAPGRQAPRLRTRTLLADTPLPPYQCHIGATAQVVLSPVAILRGLVRVHFRGQRTLLRHQTQH